MLKLNEKHNDTSLLPWIVDQCNCYMKWTLFSFSIQNILKLVKELKIYPLEVTIFNHVQYDTLGLIFSGRLFAALTLPFE